MRPAVPREGPADRDAALLIASISNTISSPSHIQTIGFTGVAPV